MTHTIVKNSCATTYFLSLPYFDPYVEPCRVWFSSNHCHLRLDPKLYYGKNSILGIPSPCVTLLGYKSKALHTGDMGTRTDKRGQNLCRLIDRQTGEKVTHTKKTYTRTQDKPRRLTDRYTG